LLNQRQQFKDLLTAQEPIFAPLCLDALSSRIVTDCGFGAGYVSGGALGYAHGVSEALLTLSELTDTTRHITLRSDLPIIVDGGVGFGDPVHVARTVWEIEATGAVAIEIEDQVAPKRVSHHRGIEHLISRTEMVQKIEHAVAARSDTGFQIIARTGAVKNETFDDAVDRGNAYRQAGADIIMLMPQEDEEWQRAPALIDAPLAAITSLDARTSDEWKSLGWQLIIDPFTAQVVAVDAVRNAYRQFQMSGKTGLSTRKIFETYRQLPQLAGLDRLFEIEDQTTEKK
jgi:2-methylisocitrate lyase-like PEP mutase family enzyme